MLGSGKMQATPVRTLMIVHHQAIYREGLRRLLYDSGFHTIWCDADLPPDMTSVFSQEVPELLLVDAGRGRARQQIIEVKRLYPSSRIVILLDADPQEGIDVALECGADSVIRRET